MMVAVCGAGLIGIDPPDYVAATVAFAFGLAASSFFPAIIMGIFVKHMSLPPDAHRGSLDTH